MNRASAAVAVLAGLLVAGLLAQAIVRVGELMGLELDRAGETTRLTAGAGATLLEADLDAGDDVTFELCSSDPMEPARWSGAGTLVVDVGESAPRDRALTEAIDGEMLERARRGVAGGCVDFARAGSIGESGHYVIGIEGVTEALAGVDVRARVVAERPLLPGDRNAVLGILLGALVLVIGLALRTPTAHATEDEPAPEVIGARESGPAIGYRDAAARVSAPAVPPPRVWALSGGLALVSLFLVVFDPRLSLVWKLALGAIAIAATLGSGLAIRRGRVAAGAVLGVVAIVDLSTVLSIVTPPGPAFGLAAGLVLAVAEVLIALALARTFTRGTGLGVHRPDGVLVAWAAFVAAPIVGVLLRIAAVRILALVPSTGEAPIEAYVSWPSGLLSFAALSAIAPIGEEVFFRGFVYGALRGEGGRAREALAFFGAWLLFVVAHLPQTWGSWGGLAAIAIAGLGFTTLRAVTGSVLVAAMAHLVYNGLLAVAALT